MIKSERAARAALSRATREAAARWCDRPIVWGKTDCAMSQAEIEMAVFGRDPAAHLRGRYRSRRGSLRILGREGLLGEMGRVAAAFGWLEVEPPRARCGDLAVVRTATGPALVRRYGRGWVGPIDFGVAEIPRTDPSIIRAWSVL